MIDLHGFLYKNVVIITADGKTYSGYVDFFESSYENESDEESIGIIQNKDAKEGIELYQSQIQSIKILE